ncbi:MAG TPA: hypothetical protein VGI20_00535 [Rhizomicrobium sp.]|jgi:uncharacterized membrane protein YraQ (UPF0718 family)
MATSDQTAMARALGREWLIARIVIIGGFAIAILAGAWFGVVVPRIIEPRRVQAELATRADTLLKDEAQICSMALASAKNFGIVPQYGQLATTKLAATGVRGRYVCLAATSASKYILAVDLICRDLKSPRCTALYNVMQADGTVLYQRQS